MSLSFLVAMTQWVVSNADHMTLSELVRWTGFLAKITSFWAPSPPSRSATRPARRTALPPPTLRPPGPPGGRFALPREPWASAH